MSRLLLLAPPAPTQTSVRSWVLRGRQLLAGLMWLILAAYLIGLARHGHGYEPLVDGWLGGLSEAVPAAACWAAVPVATGRRREVGCLAAAVTAYAAGNVLFIVASAHQVTPPFPSTGDAAYLCFYPLALIAIVLAVTRQHRSIRVGVCLDSLLGGLAAAAVLAVVLQRIFTAASGSPLAVAVALAYPTFDLLLVAAVVAVFSLQGRRTPRHWWPLLIGLLVFAGADIVYVLRVSAGSYRLGTPLDGLWSVGLALRSIWVWAPATATGSPRDTDPSVALAVPALSTAASIAVLVAATQTHVSTPAVAVATGTLLIGAGRTQLAFRQLRRFADLHRQATSDDLTGLPNRRAFYSHATTTLAGAPRAAGPAPARPRPVQGGQRHPRTPSR